MFSNVDRQIDFPLRLHNREETLQFLAGGVRNFWNIPQEEPEFKFEMHSYFEFFFANSATRDE
jgi:hypothetical protein